MDTVLSLSRPLLYNRELHFLDFSALAPSSPPPRWVSHVRDPTRRFLSRFAFARQSNNLFDFKTFHLTEPEAVGNLTKEEWLEKDLNECVLTGDSECDFRNGSFRDFAIVS